MTVVAVLTLATGCGGGGEDAGPRWHADYVSTSCGAVLTRVLPVSSDEGWAVGQEPAGCARTSGRDGTAQGVVLHRHGDTWRRATLPSPLLSPYHGAQLAGAALAASGPDDVWLFGRLGSADTATQGMPAAARWDGRRWTRITTDFDVAQAVVFAPDDVWALCSNETTHPVRHWDGRRWTAVSLPVDVFGAMAGTGHGDLWVVGSDRNPGGAGHHPAIAHFDGTGWTAVPTPTYRNVRPGPDDRARLTAVVPVSATDAWAFGVHVDGDTGGGSPGQTVLALHWDGTRWRQAPKALTAGMTRTPPDTGLSATTDGAGGFVLATLYGVAEHRTAAGVRRTIGRPAPVAGRSGKTPDRQRLQVYDLARVPGTREVWAAGAVGLTLHGGDDFARATILSYPG